MRKELRPRSVYDVMAAIGCFAALATGTAYAANTIGSADIINESILSADIKNGEVRNADVATSAITSAKIYNGSVLNADLGLNSVTSDKVLDGTLTTSDIDERSLRVRPHVTIREGPPGGPTTADAFCNWDEVATGGGGWQSHGFYIYESRPAPSYAGVTPNGWSVSAGNPFGGAVTGTTYAYAICAAASYG